MPVGPAELNVFCLPHIKIKEITEELDQRVWKYVFLRNSFTVLGKTFFTIFCWFSFPRFALKMIECSKTRSII